MTVTTPILQVKNLSTCFRTDDGVVTAVDDASFEVFPNEILGIVGESGSGKTVTSKSIMRLLPAHTGFLKPETQILFQGKNLAQLTESQMRQIRGKHIAMIFQEPMTSLNPVFTVGWQLDEVLQYHTKLDSSARRARAIEMLDLVETPNAQRRYGEYPHQLSGGMRQRVMIAMALCCDPGILIADEPTTALDVTIQAQILRLMNVLKAKLDTAILLITHDLGVVAQVCDRVLVMYAGRVIETGPVRDIFHKPQHPYTQALLGSIPRRGRKVHGQRLTTIPGIVPGLLELPVGCRFTDRCKYAADRCREVEPELAPGPDNRPVRCHFPLSPDEGSKSPS